jgi:hypothetical protein
MKIISWKIYMIMEFYLDIVGFKEQNENILIFLPWGWFTLERGWA